MTLSGGPRTPHAAGKSAVYCLQQRRHDHSLLPASAKFLPADRCGHWLGGIFYCYYHYDDDDDDDDDHWSFSCGAVVSSGAVSKRFTCFQCTPDYFCFHNQPNSDMNYRIFNAYVILFGTHGGPRCTVTSEGLWLSLLHGL